MSSERRVVRPYHGLARFQMILDQLVLHIGSETCKTGANLSVSSSSLRSDPVVLRVADDAEAAEQARNDAIESAEAIGLTPEQVEFVVVASTPYLRLADVVHRRSLADSDCLPETIAIKAGDAARALLTPAGGCDISAFLVLADQLEPTPLRPHRLGTWFGRAQFSLRTELGELGFTPRPLTAAKREELGLHAEAIRFVEVDAAALLGERLDDAVDLYVDETLLSHLNLAADSPASRSFQRQLFVDVMGAVCRATADLDQFETMGLAELEDTVLAHLIDALAGKPAPSDSDDLIRQRKESLLDQMKQTPDVFVANLEALSRPREDLRVNIGGLD